MTIHELAESGEFQGLFQHGFGEAFNKLNGKVADVNFLGAAEFSFTAVDAGQFAGLFNGEVETFEGPSGETSGTLNLKLPLGLDEGDLRHILDVATLKVDIEVFPGW